MLFIVNSAVRMSELSFVHHSTAGQNLTKERVQMIQMLRNLHKKKLARTLSSMC